MTRPGFFISHLFPAASHRHTTGSLISISLSAISSTCFLFHPSPLVKNIVRFVCMSFSCITVCLTSYQKLDTLDILKVEEYWNPASSYTTIVVVSENNDFDYARFVINYNSDTLLSDSNWMLKYDGNVEEIAFTFGNVSHFSSYVVGSSRNNVFLIQVNSEEMHAENSGHDIILENLLFIKKH